MKDLVPTTVPITGYPDEVDAALRLQRRMGRLVDRPSPAYPIGDGRVFVTAVLLAEPPKRPKARRLDDSIRQVLTALLFVVGALFSTGVTVWVLVAVAPQYVLPGLMLVAFAQVAGIMFYLLRR